MGEQQLGVTTTTSSNICHISMQCFTSKETSATRFRSSGLSKETEEGSVPSIIIYQRFCENQKLKKLC